MYFLPGTLVMYTLLNTNGTEALFTYWYYIQYFMTTYLRAVYALKRSKDFIQRRLAYGAPMLGTLVVYSLVYTGSTYDILLPTCIYYSCYNRNYC